MAELSQDITRLSPEKRNLLVRLLRKQGVDLESSLILPQERNAEGYALSFSQQRLWFLHQLDTKSTAYNMPLSVRLEGPLQRSALAATLCEIVRRHESLRTTFRSAAGEPIQVIDSNTSFHLPVVDLCGLPSAQHLPVARSLVREEAEQTFDLAQGSLFQGCLIALGEQDHLLLLTTHHIVSDGWSTGVLVKELGVLYSAYSQGHPSPLPPLPIQYLDFAVWQRRRLSGLQLDQEFAYWREQLRGLAPESTLPTDRPRPTVQRPRGKSCPLVLHQELSARLQVLCHVQGVTLFMTLLAAFGALLARHSGQSDLGVGTLVAGRSHRQLEELIGFFVNALVLRLDLSGDPSFSDLVARIRKMTLAAYAHENLPFEKLVAELQPVRELARTPLFQVMFVLQNTPIEPLEVSGLKLRPFSVESYRTIYDLNLKMSEAGGVLVGVAEYNSDLFDTSAIWRLLGRG